MRLYVYKIIYTYIKANTHIYAYIYNYTHIYKIKYTHK